MENQFGVGLTFLENELLSVINSEIISFSDILAKYFQELNRLLVEYNSISYEMDPLHKITAKAVLKYSYEISTQCTNILRFIEQNSSLNPPILEDVEKLKYFIDKKSEIIQTIYTPVAKKELTAFYSEKFRSSLDSALLRFYKRKYTLK